MGSSWMLSLPQNSGFVSPYVYQATLLHLWVETHKGWEMGSVRPHLDISLNGALTQDLVHLGGKADQSSPLKSSAQLLLQLLGNRRVREERKTAHSIRGSADSVSVMCTILL